MVSASAALVPVPATAPAVPPTWLCRLRSTQVHRMWLITCVVALLVLFGQYHVSTSWFNPAHLGNAVDSPGDTSAESTSASTCLAPAEVHDVVRTALRKLVDDAVLEAAIEARVVREVADKLRAVTATSTSPPQPPPHPSESVTSPSTVTTPSIPTTTPCSPLEEWYPPAVRPAHTFSGIPPIYIVTPTYRRPEQLAELTRLAQTLLLVRNVHWLVVEDSAKLSPNVAALLSRIGVPHHHLHAPMPEQFRKKRGAKPKGVSQRNRALEWLKANATRGTLYFADDDNTYDIAIFEEMRWTKRVSMWPVGLCTKFGLSTPVVSSRGFSGFYDGWVGGRKFPVDMAGFAVAIPFLHQRPKAHMPYAPGFEEDGFLRSLAPFEPRDIELKADNCTKVLVWHTQTKSNPPSIPMDARFSDTNVALLKKTII